MLIAAPSSTKNSSFEQLLQLRQHGLAVDHRGIRAVDTLRINTGVGFNMADAMIIQSLCSYAFLKRILEQALNQG
jgi:hypothetical protein